MWVEAFLSERRDFSPGPVKTVGKNVSDSEPGEWTSALIQKNSGFGPRVDLSLCAEGSQHLRGLRPQRTEPLLPAFTKQPELIRRRQLKITGPQIDYLLNAGARIEHGGQQDIVPPAGLIRPVDPGKNRLDLCPFEIFDRTLTAAFEGHAQNALRPLELVGML
jgi:hypothetical protein